MTQSDWLSHRALQIIKGIGATPGDTYTAENPPQVVNLMGGAITLDDWSPNIPAMKGGGVWASSPIADGRQLIAAPVGNVTEKMSILISDSSYLGVQKQLTALNQIVQDCRDFWQSEYQIDPVYLMWYASCGAGPQYALIYNIDLAPEYEQSPTPTIRVSITIEREPAWRGIPPGANPKIWTYEVNQSNPQFNVNVATLVTGVVPVTDSLLSFSIRNRHEWKAASYGLQSQSWTEPFIRIPATAIPGDAPALCSLSLYSSLKIESLFVALTSKDYSGVDHTGVARYSALNLAAGDGNSAGVVTKTNVGAGNGLLSNGSDSIYYAGIRTATGIDANYVTACGWGGATGANGIKLDRQFYRGTFAVFVRATNNSGSPTLGDMKMRIFIEEFEDAAGGEYITNTILPETNVPLTVVSPGMVLSYMGTVSLPLGNRAVVSPLGYGIQLQETNSNLRISLQVKYGVATANRIFYVLDVILIPIDEGMMQLVAQSVAPASVTQVILDNTGYLNRGDISQTGITYISNPNSGGAVQEIRGQPIMLKPGVDQRVHFLSSRLISSGGEASLSDQLTIALNIVPRWYGIRDI